MLPRYHRNERPIKRIQTKEHQNIQNIRMDELPSYHEAAMTSSQIDDVTISSPPPKYSPQLKRWLWRHKTNIIRQLSTSAGSEQKIKKQKKLKIFIVFIRRSVNLRKFSVKYVKLLKNIKLYFAVKLFRIFYCRKLKMFIVKPVA